MEHDGDENGRVRLEGHMEGFENHKNWDLCLVCKKLKEGSDITALHFRKVTLVVG